MVYAFMQVARVKNKWKCVLKDGMIHVNGKDYLFAKCTWLVDKVTLYSYHIAHGFHSEFEW
jgi:hypothetical protein